MAPTSGLDIQSQYRSAAVHSTVGIVGAGSIGCFLGAILAQDKSLAVQFFGREALGLELAAYGLSAGFPSGNVSAIAPAFYTSMVSLIECDIILLTVKATSLPSLIPQLKKFIRPDVPVVALQNGIGVDTMLSASLNNPVYRAVVPFNVVKTGPGHFQQTSSGQLLWPHSKQHKMDYLAAIFRQYGSGVQLCGDMRAVEYGKLLLNLNNALNALSGLPLKQQLLQQDIRQVLAAAMQEWLQVAKALQVTPHAMTLLPNVLLPWLLRLPTWLFRLLARQMLQIDEAARSSMWDDIQAGRRTEVMYLNGAVVRLGIETGIATPVNAAIVELVKHLEQGETLSLTPLQLRQQLLQL